MLTLDASKFLSKSQRPAPLFDGALSGVDSDTEHFLNESMNSSTGSDPPEDLHVERPGYSLWAQNVQQWQEQSQTVSPPLAAEEVEVEPSPESHPRAQEPENNAENSSKLEVTIGIAYLVSMALSLATATLVTITAPPNRESSVYPLLVRSSKALIGYSCLSALIAFAWLRTMASNPRAMVQMGTITIPGFLVLVGLYSIVMSIHKAPHHGVAHAALRCSSLVPLSLAAGGVAYLRHRRDLVGRATEMIALVARIYSQAAFLWVVPLGLGLAALVSSALWALFITRGFLEGGFSILLALWFTFMYMWSWNTVCALTREVLAGVASQWYGAHEPMGLAVPIYQAQLGSAALSALLQLVVRLPLLILPVRPVRWFGSLVISLMHASSGKLLDPFTLPTATICRCTLTEAAAKVSNFDEDAAFRLAKVFLKASRICCSLSVALIAWVHADRLNDSTSVYGYVVASVALFFGWTIAGASENTLSMLLDGVRVCFLLDPTEPRRNAEADRVFNMDVNWQGVTV